jgi:hypothetical protein
VHYDVRIVHELRYQSPVFDRIQVVCHPLFRFQVPDVLHASGGKIIQENYMIAPFEQAFSQMRPNEAGTTSDQIAHHASREKLQRL